MVETIKEKKYLPESEITIHFGNDNITTLQADAINNSVYRLDLALDILSNLYILTDKKADAERNPDIKHDLEKMRDMLAFEKEAVYSGGEIQDSIIDKAFRLYAPILKKYYASC